MSWLTDLAGKAENLLNKIDQNAAVALKDKIIFNEQLQDVIWKTTPSVGSHESDFPHTPPGLAVAPSLSPLPRSAPSGAASPPSRLSPSRSDIAYSKRNDDDDLLRFLNSSEPILPVSEELRGSPSGASAASVGSASPVNMVDTPSAGHSRNTSQGGMSSMSSSFVSTAREDYQDQELKLPESIENYTHKEHTSQLSLSSALSENNLLKNEVRCLNNELALLLQRSKAAEKEVNVAGQELSMLRETLTQNELLGNQVQMLQAQLTESEKSISTLSAENKRLKDSRSSKVTSQAKDLASASERLKQLELEHENLSQESNELRSQVSRLQESVTDAVQQSERYRLQITDVTNEAEQYRVRATRVLQEKEKLIANLQAAKQADGISNDSMADQEIEQLREELELHRQESASQAKQLQAVRNDLHMCELQQEEHRQKAETEIDRLQRRLQEELTRRQAAEEDCRSHIEELQTAKSEMNQQHEYLRECLKTKEDELSRLKKQSQISNQSIQCNSDSSELEARVRNLATTLIQKQGALEALIAERNSLRLKLERVEKLSSGGPTVQSSSFNGGTVVNLNENESGNTRLRVPTLLSESPGDTVVTRRVKRAYSSLDTLGIRIGAFLRRYPLARILVILYMVLLHLWVAVVLFSYSPEGYSSNGIVRSPPAITLEEPQGV